MRELTTAMAQFEAGAKVFAQIFHFHPRSHRGTKSPTTHIINVFQAKMFRIKKCKATLTLIIRLQHYLTALYLRLYISSMKKTFTLASFVLLGTGAMGQSPITINASDLVLLNTYHLRDITALSPPQPVAGANMTWDYSGYPGGTSATNNYPAETISFFATAGADVRYTNIKKLGWAIEYDLAEEWDLNSTGVSNMGLDIPYQVTDLSSFPLIILR